MLNNRISKEVPHLSRTPIVEAAIEILVVPSSNWDDEALRKGIGAKAAEFPKIVALRETKLQIAPPSGQGSSTIHDFGCIGFKLHSEDNLNIAHFKKDAFAFSRLRPYTNWKQFHHEAMRLWSIYCELLEPTEARRIGLRFINRIAAKETAQLAEYYRHPPSSLKSPDWPLAGYFHHDVMKVPEESCVVNLIKTIQHTHGEIGLILDIDVFMQDQFDCDKPLISNYLEKMRRVKNEVFFGSITEKALEAYK